ncbi:MAG: hypothetical protein AB1505_10930 [Candidatus Latescibacterota bacterium]
MAPQLYRSEMTEKEKAAFIQAHGMSAFLGLPWAPVPEEAMMLHRSEMNQEQRVEFVRRYGQAALDRLPL